MAFREDVARVLGLETAYRSGLQALSNTDRRRVHPQRPASIGGSVNIDKALKRQAPNASRWDYAVAYANGNPQAEKLYWIEVHPATSGANVNQVVAKYTWLRTWLATSALRLDGYPREFVWIASGKSAYHPGTPVRKRLASQGIRFAGEDFAIPG